MRLLGDVEPGERARELAAEHRKDARLVQVVLDESDKWTKLYRDTFGAAARDAKGK